MAVRGGRERVDILAMDLDRLKADLAQEVQMKEMLEQSMNELTKTVDDMENRIENISDESNEWKTRFETQQEVNQQLEKQIILLQDKVDLARKSAREMQSKAPQEIFTKVDFSDVSRQTLKVMDREKQSLLNQLRGIEWRTDQESKAYHKANEERKQYHAEIAATKQVLSSLEQRGGRVSMVASQAPSTYQSHYYESENQSPRYTLKNIPPDQRIIDPRRGPIKKTAAVKNLPRLNAAAADA